MMMGWYGCGILERAVGRGEPVRSWDHHFDWITDMVWLQDLPVQKPKTKVEGRKSKSQLKKQRKKERQAALAKMDNDNDSDDEDSDDDDGGDSDDSDAPSGFFNKSRRQGRANLDSS